MKKQPAKSFQDLILAKDLGYGDIEELMEQLEEVSKLLQGYMSTILRSTS